MRVCGMAWSRSVLKLCRHSTTGARKRAWPAKKKIGLRRIDASAAAAGVVQRQIQKYQLICATHRCTSMGPSTCLARSGARVPTYDTWNCIEWN